MSRLTMPAREFLASQVTASADLMITDPPWLIPGAGKFETAAPYPKQTPAVIAATLQDARRVLRPGCHLYLFLPSGSLASQVLREMERHGWRFQRLLAWRKNGAGLGAWRNTWEPIAIFSNGAPRKYERRGHYPSLLVYPRPGRRTAKPWQLYATFLEMSSRPGELILDPYCGANPLQRAAEARGRSWLAADILGPDEVAAQMQRHPPRRLPRRRVPTLALPSVEVAA